MLKIEKFVTMSPAQYEIIIEGMRNPKNSWDRSDSYTTHICDEETMEIADFAWFMGDNDHKLAERLADGGPVHAKYRRMMIVYLTVNAPFYWWKEFDTYKVGTVCNSCSTMHKIHSKEFELSDFSVERFSEDDLKTFDITMSRLEANRKMFLALDGEAIGYDLETIMQMNVDKLRARYPDGFDTEHSLHRATNDI